MDVPKVLFQTALDFILPPLCISCRCKVQDHNALCPACWSSLNFIQKPYCDQLGFSLPFDENAFAPELNRQDSPIVSATAIAMNPYFDHARSVAYYEGIMRDLIHSFKYYAQMEGKHLFGRWMAVAAADFLGEADLIIPVPLYRRKLFQRRFNQAAILADSLGQETGIEVDSYILKRVKNTVQQVGLSAQQRKLNVAGAFKVEETDKILLKGKKVLLIDDVFTTGSTANACARTLKKAGVVQVDLITLARVNEPINPVL